MPPSITKFTANASHIGRYQKFELTFYLDKTFPPNSFLPYYFFDPADPRGIDGIVVIANRLGGLRLLRRDPRQFQVHESVFRLALPQIKQISRASPVCFKPMRASARLS